MGGNNIKILGIDPGTAVSGYGLIIIKDKEPNILNFGLITPPKKADHFQRLKFLYENTYEVIKKYNPDVLAIEAPFYGKNVQVMLKLGRAQGVMMAAAISHGIPIYEYAPLKVKEAITGMGRASKEQVAYFLQKVYGLKNLPEKLDATDAIAVAICHFIQINKPTYKKDYKNWEDFIKKNPDKVK